MQYNNKVGIINAISQTKGVVRIDGVNEWLIAKKDAIRQSLLSLSKGSKVEYNIVQEQGKKEIELIYIKLLDSIQSPQAQSSASKPIRQLPQQKGTILRHLMPVQGLNSDDVQAFEGFKVKANKEQLGELSHSRVVKSLFFGFQNLNS